MESVYSAVRTDSLYKADGVFSLKGSCSVESECRNDVSLQPIGPIFKDFLTFEDGTDRLYRNVGMELPL